MSSDENGNLIGGALLYNASNILDIGMPPSGVPVWMLVHGGSLVYGHHALRRWWSIFQGALGPDCVVMVASARDEDLGLT